MNNANTEEIKIVPKDPMDEVLGQGIVIIYKNGKQYNFTEQENVFLKNEKTLFDKLGSHRCWLNDYSGSKVRLNNKKIESVNLYSDQLTELIAKNTSFAFSCLYRTRLQKAILHNSSFEDAWMQYVNLYGAKAENAKFNNANMREACFHFAELYNSVFINTNLENATFCNADLRKANFSNANLKNANFIDAKIKGADFTGANQHGAIFEKNDPLNIPPGGRICTA